MIDTVSKQECTGCMACLAVCPCNAIYEKEDEEGFIYPIIDTKACIKCGKCETVCPALESTDTQYIDSGNYKNKYYAGQLIDDSILQEVSSGGAFWALMVAVIDNGGVVYGAVQDDVDIITHKRAANLEDAKAFRRSKYFQSEVSDCYRLVKEDLLQGRQVLFSGTGCQIAGLKGYLQKDYDNLYTCDVVCHGVPSMKVWREYRKEKEEREGKKITGLIFRDKSRGWSKNQYKITYDDGSVEYERSTVQKFHAGYLKGLFYRPSCGLCKYAHMPRQGDITLADFWQYEGKLREGKPDDGISLIVVNSDKGQELLTATSAQLYLDSVTEEEAFASCRHLHSHPTENPDRAEFFRLFYKEGYYAAINKYLKKSDKNVIKRIYHKLKNS